MALAVLDDLAALGVVNYNEDPTGTLGRKAQWLLDRISEQVHSYIGSTDVLIAANADGLWTSVRVGVLSAVVTEAAASRLQAAPQSFDGSVMPEAMMSALLQPRHYRALDKLIGSANSSMSMVVERDEDLSFFRTYDGSTEFGWA